MVQAAWLPYAAVVWYWLYSGTFFAVRPGPQAVELEYRRPTRTELLPLQSVDRVEVRPAGKLNAELVIHLKDGTRRTSPQVSQAFARDGVERLRRLVALAPTEVGGPP